MSTSITMQHPACPQCAGTDVVHGSIDNGLIVYDYSEDPLPEGYMRHEDVLCILCATIERDAPGPPEWTSEQRKAWRNRGWFNKYQRLVGQGSYQFLKKSLWIIGAQSISNLKGRAVIENNVWTCPPVTPPTIVRSMSQNGYLTPPGSLTRLMPGPDPSTPPAQTSPQSRGYNA
ncbi:MAG: hypothetical protein M1828_003314 [Chrysothrix sp. TS-e1954]|nr:MAG: hypothetical protein M1828_003314 [Chrysothrix sp. TS-e1954]